jgi:hypothetical protein
VAVNIKFELPFAGAIEKLTKLKPPSMSLLNWQFGVVDRATFDHPQGKRHYNKPSGS